MPDSHEPGDELADQRLRADRAPQGRVLALLLLAYIFNFIDRQIIGVLTSRSRPSLA